MIDAGLVVANARASFSIFSAGTPVISSAASGVYSLTAAGRSRSRAGDDGPAVGERTS